MTVPLFNYGTHQLSGVVLVRRDRQRPAKRLLTSFVLLTLIGDGLEIHTCFETEFDLRLYCQMHNIKINDQRTGVERYIDHKEAQQ